jgi:hypothetical protein
MKEISSLDYEEFGLTREHFDLGQAQLDPARAAKDVETRKSGFLSRQFEPRATRAQKVFDVVVGIVLPVLCLYFDPLVFRGDMMGAPVLGRFRLFAYAVVAVEICALALWLAAGARVKEWGGMLGGAMLAGALFSFVVGVLILPFSLIGLMVLIGALGFVPFLTAFVYLRNAWRAAGALGRAGAGSHGLAAVALACGFFFAWVAPAVLRVWE